MTEDAGVANNRLFAEAVLWVARTSGPWRDLPAAFGSGNRTDVTRWADKNVWHNIFAVLREDADFEEFFSTAPSCVRRSMLPGQLKKGASSGEPVN
ncbi:MAG: hypothetical protein NVSMB6_13010 [Burkholderiaceae bacterium]